MASWSTKAKPRKAGDMQISSRAILLDDADRDYLDDFGWFPPDHEDTVEGDIISSGPGDFQPYRYEEDE